MQIARARGSNSEVSY